MDVDALRQAAGLKPLPKAAEVEPDDDGPKCQHGCATVPCRHTITSVDPFLGLDRELRGIPLVGAGGGAIAGTRPGDSAKALDDEGHEIIRQRMAIARKRMKDHR